MSAAREPFVAVTGGAGFIGSELVRQLVDDGWRVRVLDTLVNGRRQHLASLPPDRCELVVGDVRDAATVERALDGASRVFHLACLGVRHSLHSPVENHEVNATGSLVVARAALAAGVERYVHVSSSEVYGSAQSVPMDESHPCRPTTVYGASKLAGEAYARALHASAGLPAVVVRPFNAYGPRCHHEGDSGEVIPKFVLRALAGRPLVVFGDGAQTRDFTSVSDVAAGLRAAADTPRAVGGTFNLGSGREIAIRELADRVLRLVGTTGARVEHAQARPADVRRLVADGRLAREVLGFRVVLTLEQGLDALLQWYRSRPASAETLLHEERTFNWHADRSKREELSA